MSRILKAGHFVSALFASSLIFGAVISDTIFVDPDGYDAYVNSASSGMNYAGDANLYVHKNGVAASSTQRTYMFIDLTDIPTNAILTKATLRLYGETVVNTGNHDMLVSRVTSSWTETGVK